MADGRRWMSGGVRHVTGYRALYAVSDRHERLPRAPGPCTAKYCALRTRVLAARATKYCERLRLGRSRARLRGQPRAPPPPPPPPPPARHSGSPPAPVGRRVALAPLRAGRAGPGRRPRRAACREPARGPPQPGAARGARPPIGARQAPLLGPRGRTRGCAPRSWRCPGRLGTRGCGGALQDGCACGAAAGPGGPVGSHRWGGGRTFRAW